MTDTETVLIVGAGAGLSASVARRFADRGAAVTLAARDTGKLSDLSAEIDARIHSVDVAVPESVDTLFDAVLAESGPPHCVLFNPSRRVRGPVTDLDTAAVRAAIDVTAYGGFLVGRRAAQAMVAAGRGSILFTGASASVKGFANSSAFAMGKFALRGLAQSMARELAPRNVHVAHFVIDGGIGRDGDPRQVGKAPDAMLDPDEIADTYLHVHGQHRSAWTWEIELRPWTETF